MKTKEIILRLAKFLKPYRVRFGEAMVSMAFVAGLKSIRLYLLKPGLDKLIASKNVSLLIKFAAILLLITVLYSVFSYIQNYLLAYIGEHVVVDLRDRTYAHIQELSLPYYITRPTGGILSRLTNDMMYVQNAITSIPTKLIKDGLSCIGIVIVLFAFNWKWTIFSFLFFPFIVYPISVLAKKMRKTSRQTQEKMAEIYSLLTEKISGIKVTKAFAQEIREVDEMKKNNREYFNVIMRLLRAATIQNPLLEVITYTISIILASYVIYSILHHVVPISTGVAYLAALVSFYAPVKSLTDVNKQLQMSVSAAERIFALNDAKVEVKETPEAVNFTGIQKEIRFEDVSFSYSGEKPERQAIKNINISIQKGKIFALVGPSGGGKTTIANLIPRFFDPTSGRVAIDGRDIRDFKLASLRRHIGIVSQDIMLFNDTVRNNIAYGMPEADFEKVERAAKLANAWEFIMKLPQKFDTFVGERGASLSGGQAQRICIARAVLADPPILVLDEATSSLDTEAEMLIQKALDKIQKGRTTLVIAHRLSTVRKADCIAVISGGTVVEQGCHDELISANGHYRKLYDIQLI